MQPARYRMKWRSPGKHHEEAKSFQERLAEINRKDPELNRPINIGYRLRRKPGNVRAKIKQWVKEKVDKEHAARHRQLKVPLEKVKQGWLQEQGPLAIQAIAEHYGVYRDLFDNAFFYPDMSLKVCYDYDEEFVTPVFSGNKIPAEEVAVLPYVEYDSDPDTLWTLVMSSPDGHLQDNDAECLHWMVGNIPGDDVDKGETICDYLQPFPPKGTGFLRYVFILYKQESRIDYSSEKRPEKCLSLSDRTFKTLDFYGSHQDNLTPAGMSFFQCEWDLSVQQLFRHVLDMREPVFEFMHPPPYHPKQVRYPHRQPFNLYLDRYRDVKDIQEEVLKERLKRISPFEKPPTKPRYLNLGRLPSSMPSWLRTRVKNMRLGRHQWKDLIE